MNGIFAIIICFIAGMGAGLGTGFAGLSAASVISPMLITFLGFNAYFMTLLVGIDVKIIFIKHLINNYIRNRNDYYVFKSSIL